MQRCARRGRSGTALTASGCAAHRNASKKKQQQGERAAAEEKKEATRRAQLERKEAQRRKKNAVPDWAVQKDPSEQEGSPVLSQQQLSRQQEAQACAKRMRSLRRMWNRHKEALPLVAFLGLFFWCLAIQIADRNSGGGIEQDDVGEGMVEMTFLAAGRCDFHCLCRVTFNGVFVTVP